MVKNISNEEFEYLKAEYKKENDSYHKKLIFHVGTNAGFYSEIGSIFEAMCYCHIHQIKFVLYADDANFSNNEGWTLFFDEFCEMDHNPVNHLHNLRGSKNGIINRIQKFFVRKVLGATYLTSDLFLDIISPELKSTPIDWPLFGMHGTVYPEAGKLKPFILHYNENTLTEINERIASVHLPAHYSSVQIRGGDIITEQDHLTHADETVSIIKEKGEYDNIDNMFVFTDDYQNIIDLKALCPTWNIYTLCRENEHGYYYDNFYDGDWEEKRRDFIKLFAMEEICISSDKHFAYEKSCANNIIRNVKPSEKYVPVIKTFF